ncbi:50S ribosomal protein L4 [Candidatus Woesearchaeota archaeon]|nr:50S ribosomal protein L4 [Candidatus Woesearchaeota archaeon]
MKATIFDTNGQKKTEKELPKQFKEKVRDDIIQRAVLALQSKRRQPYGSDPKAGMKSSADLSRRRRKYRGSYGHGISRVPRKILWRRGTHFMWVGAFAPGTVGGKKAHPPKAEKKWEEHINKKENRKAIRSAMSATISTDLVAGRGHKLPKTYPIILDPSFEDIDKTKKVRDALAKLELAEELKRCTVRKVRAGIGKLRGRKYKKKVGPLIVVSKTCKLSKACQNISGVDIVNIKSLNAERLAPGGVPGRLTLWSASALDLLEKEKLYT